MTTNEVLAQVQKLSNFAAHHFAMDALQNFSSHLSRDLDTTLRWKHRGLLSKTGFQNLITWREPQTTFSKYRV